MEMCNVHDDKGESASLIGHAAGAPSSEPPQPPLPPPSGLPRRCRCDALGSRWSTRDRRSNGWLLLWLSIIGTASVALWGPTFEAKGIQGERFGVGLEAFPPGPPRVAVCFFGLARSLKWTLPSVQKRLLDVLEEGGMKVDMFAHTYDVLEVRAAVTGAAWFRMFRCLQRVLSACVQQRESNERTLHKLSKHNGSYSGDYEQALHPRKVLVTSLEELGMFWPYPIASAHYRWKYPETAAPGIVRSIFRGYWSMATVWSLMELYSLESGFQYDAVILARPDVWFHVDTDLPRKSLPLPPRTVFLPSFDADAGEGGRINDCFAYGTPVAMKIFMNRISTFIDANAGDEPSVDMDSERLLSRHLEANNISISGIEFPLSRVRANGEIPDRDHSRVEEACYSGNDSTSCEMVRLGFKIPA
ncbi:unnamed protein product [Pylaiella littoralis]